jgi:hypothetical protein
VAVADGNSITEGTASVSAAASGVLGNDSDFNGDTPGGARHRRRRQPVGGQRDSRRPAAVRRSTGTYGALTLMPDGSYSYALDNANPAINALATGQSCTDTFTYVVSDGKGGSATRERGHHHQRVPTIRRSRSRRIQPSGQRASVAGNALANDSDPDARTP